MSPAAVEGALSTPRLSSPPSPRLLGSLHHNPLWAMMPARRSVHAVALETSATGHQLSMQSVTAASLLGHPPPPSSWNPILSPTGSSAPIRSSPQDALQDADRLKAYPNAIISGAT